MGGRFLFYKSVKNVYRTKKELLLKSLIQQTALTQKNGQSPYASIE